MPQLQMLIKSLKCMKTKIKGESKGKLTRKRGETF